MGWNDNTVVKKNKMRVFIDPDFCKGCELCINFCPENAMKVDENEYNVMGLHPVKWNGDCSLCGICFSVCPDNAIEIKYESE